MEKETRRSPIWNSNLGDIGVMENLEFDSTMYETLFDVAEMLNANPMTVHRWALHDDHFPAPLYRRCYSRNSQTPNEAPNGDAVTRTGGKLSLVEYIFPTGTAEEARARGFGGRMATYHNKERVASEDRHATEIAALRELLDRQQEDLDSIRTMVTAQRGE